MVAGIQQSGVGTIYKYTSGLTNCEIENNFHFRLTLNDNQQIQ